MKQAIGTRSGLALATVVLLLHVPVWAHPGIDRQIADMTLRIQKQPGNAELWLQRGDLHRIHRDWEAAEADFRQARKIDPELAVVDFVMGRLKLEAGFAKEAKGLLDRFLSAEPDHALARVTRARALVQLGQPLAAADDYTRALAVLEAGGRPTPTNYLERARALADAGPEHLKRAIAGLDEGLERLGQPVTLQLYAIELELTRGRPDAALKRLDKVAAQAKRQETWLVRRGEILEGAGRADAAKSAYSAALEAIASLPAARRGTRAVRALQEQAEQALERLDAAR